MARNDIKVTILGDAKPVAEAFDKADRETGGFVDSVSTKAVAIGTALGDAITKGFETAASAIGDAFGAALDREDVAATLQASLGLSPEQAAQYGDIAGNVFANAWGDSVASVGDVVASVSSSFEELGYDELETLTTQAIAFGDVFGTDVNEAINAAGRLLSTGLAESGEEAFDLLTVAMQNMPVQVRDELLAASNEYSQFFGQLGLDGEEALGLLVTASESGVIGVDKMGDALKELTIRSTDMSATSVAAYESAGLSAEDMSARFLAGGDEARGAFDDLIDGLLAIEDPVQQANASIALFGTPLEDLGTEQIPDFLAGMDSMDHALTDVAGSTQEMADAFGGTTRSKIEAFRRRIMGKLADGAALLIEKFEEFWPAIQETFGRVVAWMQANFLPVWERFVAWFKENWPRIVEALRGFATYLSATFGPMVQRVMATVVTAVQEVAGWFQRNWPQIRAVIEAVFVWLRDVGVPMVATAIDTIITVIGEVVDWCVENFPKIADAIGDAFTWINDNVVPVVETIVEAIIDAVEAVVDWFQANWDNIADIVSEVVSTVVEIVEGIVDFFGEVVDGIQALIDGDWSDAWESLKAIIDTVWNGIKLIVQAAVDVLKKILPLAWNVIKLGAQYAWDGIKALIFQAWEGIKLVAQAAVNWLKTQIMEAWDRIKSTARVVWELIKNTIHQAWEGIKLVAQAAVNWVKTKVMEAWDAIKSTASSAWTGIKDVIALVWENIKSLVTTAIASVGLTIASLPGTISALAWKFVEAGANIGKSFLNGLVNGISGAAGFFADIGAAVVSAVRGAVNSVIDTINNALEFEWELPGIIPGTLSVNPPDIPHLDEGGWIGGRAGAPMLIVAHGGEYMMSRDELAGNPRDDSPFGSGGQVTQNFYGYNRSMTPADMADAYRRARRAA